MKIYVEWREGQKELDYQTRSIKYTIKDLVNEIKSNNNLL